MKNKMKKNTIITLLTGRGFGRLDPAIPGAVNNRGDCNLTFFGVSSLLLNHDIYYRIQYTHMYQGSTCIKRIVSLPLESRITNFYTFFWMRKEPL